MADDFSEDEHATAMHKFLDLANSLAADGISMNIVSAALMTASGTYATFTHVGDIGVLTEEEVDEFADSYRAQLSYIQQIKRERLAGG